MGAPHDQLRKSRISPYENYQFQKIAVYAGTTQLDQATLISIAQSRPKWQIHVLGRIRKISPHAPGNLIFYSEIPFNEVLDFVAHADIGLAPYIDRLGIQYQTTNSNRMLLYRYHGLAILGPDRLCDPNHRTQRSKRFRSL